jgi:hypothetical protein
VFLKSRSKTPFDRAKDFAKFGYCFAA